MGQILAVVLVAASRVRGLVILVTERAAVARSVPGTCAVSVGRRARGGTAAVAAAVLLLLARLEDLVDDRQRGDEDDQERDREDVLVDLVRTDRAGQRASEQQDAVAPDEAAD